MSFQLVKGVLIKCFFREGLKFSPARPLSRLDSNRQFCVCVCLSMALVSLTDKYDTKYMIANVLYIC